MIANTVKSDRGSTWKRLVRVALLLAGATILASCLFAQENSSAAYDPYHAEKDLEVGQFYMKKGDVDAAIDRFQDAIKLKPNFARPRLLLGEAYEKKGDKAQALKYYKEYLQILPKAPDAGKIRKRIEKLSKELGKSSAALPGPVKRSAREISSRARNV